MSDKKKDPKKKESLPNNQPDNQKNLQQRHPFLRGNPNKQVPPKKNYSKLFILGVMILGGLFLSLWLKEFSPCPDFRKAKYL